MEPKQNYFWNYYNMNREEKIKQRILEHFTEAIKCQDGIVFGVYLQGSQNYNLDLDTPEYKSDIDSKAIILPSFEGFVKGASGISTTHIMENEEHIDLKDIRNMFSTFKKQNVNFIEILFTDFYVSNPEFIEENNKLRELADGISSCHPAQAIKTMAGLSMEKYKALKHPYPSIIEKIKKYGYDGKQLHHIIRINEFMERYIAGEPYHNCLVPKNEKLRDLMLEAKLNKFTLEEAEILASEYDQKNKKMKEEYIIKYGEDIVDTKPYKELDDLLYQILKKSFMRELKL